VPRASQPRVSYVVARLDRALRREIDEAVRPHDLTLARYTALSVIARRDGLSNAQLARRSYITPQSMSQVITALERDGLIVRQPDRSHRRILRVKLTAKGRRVLTACNRAVDALEQEMLAEVPPEERDALIAHLTSCVRRLGAGLRTL
jgi:DNA-binding MarR family transcriptional regulator